MEPFQIRKGVCPKVDVSQCDSSLLSCDSANQCCFLFKSDLSSLPIFKCFGVPCALGTKKRVCAAEPSPDTPNHLRAAAVFSFQSERWLVCPEAER